MSKKNKKPLPLLTNVHISDVAAEGKAIAKVDDLVIFVPFVVPGDVVDLQITKKRKNFAEARAINFVKYAEDRCNAVCEHFGVCGGCKWQILPYERQLFYKQKQVEDSLLRIGKIELPAVLPIVGSEQEYFYRNKLEFTFSNRKWLTNLDESEGIEANPKSMNGLGFHIPGMFDKVLDINKCWLQDDFSNSIRNEIRRYALNNNLSFFDLRRQEGFLRTLMIRTASTGELMVLVVFFYDDKEQINNLLSHIKEMFPQITSLLYVVNRKANDTITDQKIELFDGREYIVEEMEGLRFKIGAKSFYQTNSRQAYNLYKVVRDFARIDDRMLVYDLYTGTGTIANFVARKAKKVIGIEYVPEAIEDAKENSAINGIVNTEFFAGDMKDVLSQSFVDYHGQPDVIITDPPRAGMHEDVIKTILLASAPRIVYVSCNPATQARDLQMLDADYKIVAVQPVDMFPHTHHVENVVLLEKRKTVFV